MSNSYLFNHGSLFLLCPLKVYKPIPEYEGAHRWDPDFEWTEQEERAVVKKVRVNVV
jgi:hypothetical protein